MILKVAVVSALASLICLAIIITGISRMLLRPLGNLVRGMKRVREGQFDTRVQIGTQDELGYLGDSFNNMTAHIEKLIYEVYERKISEKEAELKAIQAQLNPHFLYNTLGMFSVSFNKCKADSLVHTSRRNIRLLKVPRVGSMRGKINTCLLQFLYVPSFPGLSATFGTFLEFLHHFES
ncbi:sensor histidine kinase [Paenibacillus oralis]|uniref:sensor histidine kinase n=1 Tax=Paenibacillus oralis TaxID=2490856 RepID=UPI0015AD7933|nr:HAMP domain-containing protein [Paenibacillus oralis]